MTGPVIAIARMPGADPIDILERVIADSGFRARVVELLAGRESPRAVILPAMDALSAGSPVATDPQLVEHLADILYDAGCTEVAIGGTRDSTALWLDNRDPFILADMLGYRYETPLGRPYDVIDLAEDLVECPFPPTGSLAGSMVARAWIEADLRIVFASNRTDLADGYALCLSTLLGALPLTDKDYQYRLRRDRGAVTTALNAAAPAHFAFIDAVRSAHGPGGAIAPRAIATDTMIASPSAALADYHGALLMGLDPFVSRAAQQVLRTPGLLASAKLVGPLDPYPGWINIQPLQREAAAFRERSVAISRSAPPLAAEVDRELFPFVNPVIDRINAVVAPFLATAVDRADGHMLTQIDYWLGQIGFAAEAWAMHHDKDALLRIEAPIDIDPVALTDANFEALAGDILPLVDLLRGIPADETGLRWRSLDGAILFDGARRYPIPFEQFVGSVPIHRTIQFMNDYIGGEARPIAQDARGRVTRQVERNLYLPQPNYTVLLGGTVIDVTKIETIGYGQRRQQMIWKTIGSANGSALVDDGIVTFEALSTDTLVSVVGLQRFCLPSLLEAVNLDLFPEIKAMLVTEAYRRFFQRTFANLEAVAEGREIRIGKPWCDEDASEPLPIECWINYARARIETSDIDPKALLDRFMAQRGAASPPARIDADGFHHFEARQTSLEAPDGLFTQLVTDLSRAARVDMGLAE